MTRIFDARGNRYAVTTPDQLRRLGVAITDDAADAARRRSHWAAAAIAAVCAWPEGTAPPGAKAHCSDGLLIGPFSGQAPFDVLIVNTDATLAERSGNGLTIFAQALTESGLATLQPFTLRVHHDAGPAPLETAIEPATLDGVRGFWLDLGTPQFGPQAVAALETAVQASRFNDRPVNRVPPLATVNPAWAHSVFVRVGNPHCVTLLADAAQLPTFAALHEPALNQPLTRIAFAAGELGAGEPCPAGVNLQWACLSEPGQLEARVFERGEGPTASSGTSASAVACAAWAAGLVQGGAVHVRMPGGTAPLKLDEQDGVLRGVALFGVATRVI
ncbi:diaminopimelate epimerase [Pseudomonas sp. 21LCFQ02]|uniref:diaminopimelate epimerase n=1 Tax=Pseudomonas sp. 21LCFQ02 TaxID=2957505 RepID=UPI00209AACAD|nr:diaminopimelate epimerase [Pseudomonas sp. 21LCFQ02]MCO8167249.1 diaminopimelate epimerase [Pseudomonas sp. 21LCFQ02]